MADEDDDDVGADWAAALAEQVAAQKAGSEAPAEEYHPVDLDEIQGEEAEEEHHEDSNLDVILDIPVTLSLELGRTRVNIRHLLQLNQGSVVELDRLAGEPLDVLVNGTLVAHGEVVVVNEKYGLRLTDVVSQTERIKKLK